jgi:hypothetical protein
VVEVRINNVCTLLGCFTSRRIWQWTSHVRSLMIAAYQNGIHSTTSPSSHITLSAIGRCPHRGTISDRRVPRNDRDAAPSSHRSRASDFRRGSSQSELTEQTWLALQHLQPKQAAAEASMFGVVHSLLKWVLLLFVFGYRWRGWICWDSEQRTVKALTRRCFHLLKMHFRDPAS